MDVGYICLIFQPICATMGGNDEFIKFEMSY
jgi:hypothetical protein